MDEFICECMTCRYRKVDGDAYPCSECTELSWEGVLWEPRTLMQRLCDWLGRDV